MQKKNTTKQKLDSIIRRTRNELPLLDKSRFLTFAVPLVIVLFFLTLGLGLIELFRYQINPDATGYMQIAKRYAAGDIREAVNGYWSPLISWLLVPFVWLDIDPQLGAKILALVASVIILLVVWYVLYKQKISWWILAAPLFILSALLLEWSLAGPITGDMVFLCVATLIPLLTVRFLNNPSWINIGLLGLGGSLLYFSKAVGFYIFIVYIVLLYLARKQFSFREAKKYILVLLCFLVIIGPYVAAISYKYRQLTISTASSYNMELAKRFDPYTNEYPHPNLGQNLLTPKPHQYFINEEPNNMQDALLTNHPVTKRVALENYYHSILNNIRSIVMHPLFLAIVIGIAFLFYRNNTKKPSFTQINILYAVFGIITLASAIASVFEFRYVYILAICALLGLAVLLQKTKTNIPAAICCFFFAFLAIAPLYSTFQKTSLNAAIYKDAELVKKYIPRNANTLSDSSDSLYFCYYGQFRCLGSIIPTKDNQKHLEAYIQQQNIRYYIVTDSGTLANKDFAALTKKLKLQPVLITLPPQD